MTTFKKCEKCGSEAYRIESRFCLRCGETLGTGDAPEQNICTNSECGWRKTKFIYPDDARFCDVCGSPTAFAKK